MDKYEYYRKAKEFEENNTKYIIDKIITKGWGNIILDYKTIPNGIGNIKKDMLLKLSDNRWVPFELKASSYMHSDGLVEIVQDIEDTKKMKEYLKPCIGEKLEPNFIKELLNEIPHMYVINPRSKGWFFTSKADYIIYSYYSEGLENIKKSSIPEIIYLVNYSHLKKFLDNISKRYYCREAKRGYGWTVNLAIPWEDLINDDVATIIKVKNKKDVQPFKIRLKVNT